MLNDGFAKVWRNKGKLPLLLKVNILASMTLIVPTRGGKRNFGLRDEKYHQGSLPSTVFNFDLLSLSDKKRVCMLVCVNFSVKVFILSKLR